jgi:hypothetical protein
MGSVSGLGTQGLDTFRKGGKDIQKKISCLDYIPLGHKVGKAQALTLEIGTSRIGLRRRRTGTASGDMGGGRMGIG